MFIPTLLVFFQPDLGTSIVYVAILAGILFSKRIVLKCSGRCLSRSTDREYDPKYSVSCFVRNTSLRAVAMPFVP